MNDLETRLRECDPHVSPDTAQAWMREAAEEIRKRKSRAPEPELIDKSEILLDELTIVSALETIDRVIEDDAKQFPSPENCLHYQVMTRLGLQRYSLYLEICKKRNLVPIWEKHIG